MMSHPKVLLKKWEMEIEVEYVEEADVDAVKDGY